MQPQVDGRKAKTYCQNLCYLAKLFLVSLSQACLCSCIGSAGDADTGQHCLVLMPPQVPPHCMSLSPALLVPPVPQDHKTLYYDVDLFLFYVM